MKRLYCLIFILTVSLYSRAIPISLLPKPQQYVETRGSLKWTASTPIFYQKVSEITVAGTHQQEAYTLTVDKKGVHISAVTDEGLYRAIQTLDQLKMLPFIPCCEITDWAAFSIRGFMQDVGRSYISMDELLREIDLLSRFKVNVFHWHLTENQAWRLESKIFPELVSAQNMTRHPGKFYTQEEAKQLVRYCKERHVLLIPELDMPGHSAAFERAFGCEMQSPKGKKILRQLVEEACQVFAEVPYLHIGTDEVRFKDKTFVPDMVAYVRSLGKKVISWNPGWEYKEGEIDMTQMWSYRGKIQEGIPTIDCRLHYINHFDTFADLVSLYFSTIGREKEEKNVRGTILAIWNDRQLPDEKQIVLQNGLYPNMLAAAERAWLGGGNQYFDGTGTNIPKEGTNEFKEFQDFENRMLWHKAYTFTEEPFGYVKQTHMKWTITDAFPNGGNLDTVFPPEEEIAHTYSYQGKTYGVRQSIGAGTYLRHVWGDIVRTFYDNPEPNHTAYAYTWVRSPKNQEVGLFLEFQNYSRSEKDLPPREGTWDYKRSRIWINDEEIPAPTWLTDKSQNVTNESLLTNENAVARKPQIVKLKKGWNKVFIKLPVGKFNTPEVRLVKWMFACAFVTPDGRNALDNLKFSTDER